MNTLCSELIYGHSHALLSSSGHPSMLGFSQTTLMHRIWKIGLKRRENLQCGCEIKRVGRAEREKMRLEQKRQIGGGEKEK